MKQTKNSELLIDKNIAGIVLKPDAKYLKDIYPTIKKQFEKFDIEVILEESSAKMIDEKEYLSFDKLCNKVDFLVTIGGDGTLISVSRRGFGYNKAVLGINLGTLGFLTSVLPDELESFLEDFKNDNYVIDERMVIKANINFKQSVAFNDIVITRKSVANMVNIDAFVDGKKFNSYYGDGLVVSTPTGSTAYNLSSGGPVVFPLTEAFIVTPISAHSLTQRPLVLPTNFEIELSTPDKEGAMVIIDGQDIYEIGQNEIIKINIASSKAKLMRTKCRDYFQVLNQKLNWGK
jgi:NAD+ kinase